MYNIDGQPIWPIFNFPAKRKDRHFSDAAGDLANLGKS